MKNYLRVIFIGFFLVISGILLAESYKIKPSLAITTQLNIGSSQGNTNFLSNIGIGTTSPRGKLEVSGASYFGDSSNYAAFDNDGDLTFIGTADYLVQSDKYAFRASADEDAGIKFVAAPMAKIVITDVTGAENVYFGAGGTAATRFSYFANNVGIGTTSPPTSKLQINGTTEMTTLSIGGTAVTATAAELNYVDGVTSNVQTQLGTKAPLASPTFTGDVTMPGTGIWNSDGNVGIGTTTPTAKLFVSGIITGGFGSNSTLGTLDWNDVTNARSGSGYSLMRSTDSVNGPSSSGQYFHPFSFEYQSSKNGTGTLTQFAIPYGTESALREGIYMRGRYDGSWTGWKRIVNEDGNGNVGLGTTLATYGRLDIRGTGSTEGLSVYTGAGSTGRYWIDDSDNLIIGRSTNKDFVMDTSGNIGIGSTNISEKLKVNGNIDMSGIANRRIYMGNTGSTFGIGFTPSYPNYGIFYTEGTTDYVSISPNGSLTSPVAYFSGNGNVGIGTTAPGYSLTVDGSFYISNGTYLVHSGSSGSALYSLSLNRSTVDLFPASGNLSFGRDNSNQDLVVASTGNVGVGTATPATKLQVAGNFGIVLSTPVADNRTLCTLNTNGYVEFKDGACGTSSIVYKENINELNYGLDEINLLRPVFFAYKNYDENDSGGRTKKRIGFIAEEVAPLIPEVVLFNDDGSPDSIDYPNLIPLLTKGIQEQQQQIDILTNKFLILNKNLSLTSSGDLNLESIKNNGSTGYQLKDKNSNLITRIGAFAEMVVGKIQAGLIETKKLLIDGVDIIDKINQLSEKIDKQQKEINELKKELERLKNSQ